MRASTATAAPSHQELDDAMYEIERLLWAYKSGDGAVDREGLRLLDHIRRVGSEARTYRDDHLRRQREEVVKGVLMDRLPDIYERFAGGALTYEACVAEVESLLAFVGIQPSEPILDELVVDNGFIINALDGDEQRKSPGKGRGAVETAAYTLAAALKLAGFEASVGQRILLATRTLSPRARARLACSEPFGSNATLPRGASPVTTGTPKTEVTFGPTLT